jgi:hypothetical protein
MRSRGRGYSAIIFIVGVISLALCLLLSFKLYGGNSMEQTQSIEGVFRRYVSLVDFHARNNSASGVEPLHQYSAHDVMPSILEKSNAKPPVQVSMRPLPAQHTPSVRKDIGLLCNSSDLQTRYSTVINEGKVDLCQEWKKKYSVKPGESWGFLPKTMHAQWREYSCDELTTAGRDISCDDMWGWKMIDNWLSSNRSEFAGRSSMACAKSTKSSRFCRLINVEIDFSLAKLSHLQRTFLPGFVTAYTDQKSIVPPIPEGFQAVAGRDMKSCTSWEKRPTFFMSHDDIFNFGHNMNDVMIVWTMLRLSGRVGSESLYVHMDGIRTGGPAGGPSHKLSVAGQPDFMGPFFDYYRAWFNETIRAVDYKASKICFSEVYFQPFPGVPFIWQDWTSDSKCSFVGPSPIYQSFSLDVLTNFQKFFGKDAFQPPSIDKVHIVIENRKAKDRSLLAVGRVINNAAELINALASIPGVTTELVSLGSMPFKRQIATVHSASILIAMHGAGAMQIVHMALGKPNCCGFVEIFPKLESFVTIRGGGNMARYLGIEYGRVDVQTNVGIDGSSVDVEQLKSLVSAIVAKIKNSPTCLHNAQTERLLGEWNS